MLYIVVIQARFSLGIVARMYNTLQTHVFVAFYDLLSEWLEGHSKWGVDKVSFMYYICNVNLFLISPIWKTLNEKKVNVYLNFKKIKQFRVEWVVLHFYIFLLKFVIERYLIYFWYGSFRKLTLLIVDTSWDDSFDVQHGKGVSKRKYNRPLEGFISSPIN